MARKTTTKERDMAHELGSSTTKTYSIAEAAKHIGKSEATAKRYKKAVLAVWGSGSGGLTDVAGSLTRQGLKEIESYKRFTEAGDPAGYAADLYQREPQLDPAHDPSSETVTETAETHAVTSGDMAHVIPDIAIGNGRATAEIVPVNSVDLGRYRGGAELTLIDDPLAAARQLGAMVDGTIEAMDDDARYQQQRVQETQQAAQILRGKLSALNRRAAVYEATSAAASMVQSAAATEVQELAKEIQGE